MKGILLINTGSPTTKGRQDVKRFIKSMLSDPHLITVPDWFRPILVNGIIIPLRQFSSTAHYSQIWSDELNMSPLHYHTTALATKLEQLTSTPVEVGMRYEQPAIKAAFDRLMFKNDRLHEITVLPLFPQYANSSYRTAVDELWDVFSNRSYPFSLKVVEPYFDHPAYISALAKKIKPYLSAEYDKLIFTFHSLPLTHITEGWEKGKEFDYVFQLKETMRLVQEKLNLDGRKVRLCFHSAMGRNWLEPWLDATLEELAKEGKKKVLIVAPGFAADNLETLYDIEIKSKAIFMKNGGTHFTYIPCLNSEDYWVESVAKIVL